MKIHRAITGNALAFIACFSRNSLVHGKGFQNEELTLAIEATPAALAGRPVAHSSPAR